MEEGTEGIDWLFVSVAKQRDVLLFGFGGQLGSLHFLDNPNTGQVHQVSKWASLHQVGAFYVFLCMNSKVP